VASGPLGRLAGLRSLPSSGVRVLATGVGFIVLAAALFAGAGAWQDRDQTPDDTVAVPEPAPEPTPEPDPTPVPEPDVPGDDGTDDDDPDADGPDDDQADTPPEPPATEGPRPADVTVQLLNGIGPDGSSAVTRLRTTLESAGFRISAQNTARTAYEETTVFYTVGREAEGRLVGAALGVNRVFVMTDLPPERRLSPTVMVHVVVGADRR